MDVTPELNPETVTGKWVFVVPPLPSWLWLFNPQHLASPVLAATQRPPKQPLTDPPARLASPCAIVLAEMSIENVCVAADVLIIVKVPPSTARSTLVVSCATRLKLARKLDA
jgi:hypothetical protein